jgi:hypothetical protein
MTTLRGLKSCTTGPQRWVLLASWLEGKKGGRVATAPFSLLTFPASALRLSSAMTTQAPDDKVRARHGRRSWTVFLWFSDFDRGGIALVRILAMSARCIRQERINHFVQAFYHVRVIRRLQDG